MESGLAGFKDLLKEFRGLSVWAVGAGVAVPFAAALASLSPPWPPGVVMVTAIVELVALVFVYQFLKSARRRTINWVLSVSAVVLAIVGITYLVALSLYTYETPMTKERWVKGFDCTRDARAVFKDKCPDLGLDELKSAEYEAERLWTARSVAIVRTSLVALWALAFMALSVLLGSFIVYQSRGGKTTKPPRVPER